MLLVDESISMVNHLITMALLVLSGIIDNDTVNKIKDKSRKKIHLDESGIICRPF